MRFPAKQPVLGNQTVMSHSPHAVRAVVSSSALISFAWKGQLLLLLLLLWTAVPSFAVTATTFLTGHVSGTYGSQDP
jgi:hypothetical protein